MTTLESVFSFLLLDLLGATFTIWGSFWILSHTVAPALRFILRGLRPRF